MSVEETFEFCKRLLLRHSIKGVEGAVSLLSQQDVQVFTDYITTSYMQHHRLYQYVTSHDQGLDLYKETLFVCTAFPPPPLEVSTIDTPPLEPGQEAAAAADAAPAENAATPAKAPPAENADPGGIGALEKLIEAKTKQIQENFEKKLEIKAGTITAKLAGLGA